MSFKIFWGEKVGWRGNEKVFAGIISFCLQMILKFFTIQFLFLKLIELILRNLN